MALQQVVEKVNRRLEELFSKQLEDLDGPPKRSGSESSNSQRGWGKR
jgi:hypothetical protein